MLLILRIFFPEEVEGEN